MVKAASPKTSGREPPNPKTKKGGRQTVTSLFYLWVVSHLFNVETNLLPLRKKKFPSDRFGFCGFGEHPTPQEEERKEGG